AGNRTLMAHAVNEHDLRVTVTRVYDNNLVAWRNSANRYNWQNSDPYSRPVATRDIKLAADKNKQQDVRLSLDELLPADAPRDGVYHLALGAASTASDDSEDAGYGGYHHGRYGRPVTSAMVTLSDIGLTAKRGRTFVSVWATSL